MTKNEKRAWIQRLINAAKAGMKREQELYAPTAAIYQQISATQKQLDTATELRDAAVKAGDVEATGRLRTEVESIAEVLKSLESEFVKSYEQQEIIATRRQAALYEFAAIHARAVEAENKRQSELNKAADLRRQADSIEANAGNGLRSAKHQFAREAKFHNFTVEAALNELQALGYSTDLLGV